MSPDSAPRTFDVRHVQLARALFAAIAAIMITFSSDHSAAVGLAVFSGFAVATGLVWMLSLWLVYPAGRRWPALVLGLLALVAGMVSGVPSARTVAGFFAVVIAWAVLSGLVEALAAWRELRRRPAAAQAGATHETAATPATAPQAATHETATTTPATHPAAAHETAATPQPAPPAPRRGYVAPWVGPAGEAPPAPRAESRDALTAGILTLVLAAGTLAVPAGFSLDYTIAEAGSFTLTGITIAVGVFGGYAAVLAVYLGIAAFSPRPGAAQPADPALIAADPKDPS